MINQMMLAAIAVTICAIIGGYHVLRGEPGRGWAMVGTAIILTVLLATVFTDPIRDLYSDDGLLALGRGTGLEIAQGATGAPFASGASLDAKLDALLSHVVTAGVRHPLQVLNFGMVVDDIGGCRQAWSSAMMAAQGVDGAGPRTPWPTAVRPRRWPTHSAWAAAMPPSPLCWCWSPSWSDSSSGMSGLRSCW